MNPERINERNFRLIYDKFYSRLFNAAIYFLKNRELAEEVVSDVFIKLWKNRAELSEIRSLESYLFIAVRNQSFNYLNKEKKMIRVEWMTTYEKCAGVQSCPEQLLLEAELDDKMSEAVNELPTRCKEIYSKVRLDGKKHKQVSTELGISVKTIEAQIGIAIRKLTSQLAPYCIG